MDNPALITREELPSVTIRFVSLESVVNFEGWF